MCFGRVVSRRYDAFDISVWGMELDGRCSVGVIAQALLGPNKSNTICSLQLLKSDAHLWQR